jgi:hypothetical protein
MGRVGSVGRKVSQVMVVSGREIYIKSGSPPGSPIWVVYVKSAWLTVRRLASLVESLASAMSSAGFKTTKVIPPKIPRIPKTRRSSRRVNPVPNLLEDEAWWVWNGIKKRKGFINGETNTRLELYYIRKITLGLLSVF